jgi:hypothetical protein
MIKPKIVLLIFVSGKIVLTGAKVREEIYQAFEMIYPVLQGWFPLVILHLDVYNANHYQTSARSKPEQLTGSPWKSLRHPPIGTKKNPPKKIWAQAKPELEPWSLVSFLATYQLHCIGVSESGKDVKCCSRFSRYFLPRGVEVDARTTRASSIP